MKTRSKANPSHNEEELLASFIHNIMKTLTAERSGKDAVFFYKKPKEEIIQLYQLGIYLTTIPIPEMYKSQMWRQTYDIPRILQDDITGWYQNPLMVGRGDNIFAHTRRKLYPQQSKYFFQKSRDIYIKSQNVLIQHTPLVWILNTGQTRERAKMGMIKSLIKDEDTNRSWKAYISAYMKQSNNQLKNSSTKDARCMAQPPGSVLFDHQLYVKFYLRPYSPIRKLIVNARTGSGKMRMLQEVLDNFACYPNRKIIVFSTDQLRREFYTKYVRPFSHFYLQNPNQTVPAVTPELVNNRWVQRLDLFNTQYSHQGKHFGVRNRDIPFETYVRYDTEKHVRGATLVLTYVQFQDLMTFSDVEGADNFYTKGTDGQLRFDLSGAMVLFDEAHLLCETKNRKILEVLHKQAANIACLGLFTATPATSVDDLQQKFKSLIPHDNEGEKVSDYMISYHASTQGLFNKEDIDFVRVPSTHVLTTRQEITKNQNIGVLTQLWFPYLLLNNQQVREWNRLTYSTIVSGSVESIKPDDIQDILRQPDLADQYRAIMNSTNLNVWSMFFPKLTAALNSIARSTKNTRHVVMISESKGLHEMSRLLQGQNRPHVIINIESFRSSLNIQQFNLIDRPDSMRFRQHTKTKRVLDNDLLAFIHSEACGPEVVILYNSFLPEGISLFRMTHMHIIDADDDYQNLRQMMGRINRMCHTTETNPKVIRVYCMENKHKDILEQFNRLFGKFEELTHNSVSIE